ncbi:MAG: hypothetical protein M3Q71_22740 [Chloroflexota bacterium]|nr:hypothetical protein [Chloroflexota bacterium]
MEAPAYAQRALNMGVRQDIFAQGAGRSCGRRGGVYGVQVGWVTRCWLRSSWGRRDVVTFCVGHLVFGIPAGVVYVLLHPGLPLSAAL